MHTTAADNTKPSIEERYAVAISSGTGFDRIVLAAGMQRHALGAMLLRLRAEYDATRGELEHAGQIAPRRIEEQRELRAKAERMKQAGAWQAAEDLLTQADAIQRRAPGEVQSARAFILLGLGTLHEAKQALGALAMRMAASPKRNIPTEAAMRLAGRVLDVWLDETCHRCDGTGVIGNRYKGDTERQCPTCKGTGHRRDILGDSRAETAFAADLLAEMQRQVSAAAAGIRTALMGSDMAAASEDGGRGLAARLGELRSVAAAAD